MVKQLLSVITKDRVYYKPLCSHRHRATSNYIMTNSFAVGQRWASDAEPDLGLGIVSALDARTVDLSFPTSQTTRRYSRSGAPLRRILFKPGDTIQDQSGNSLRVSEITETIPSGCVVYRCGTVTLHENAIADTVNTATPMQRLLYGKSGTSEAFASRLRMLHYHATILQSPVRGFVGGRVELLPHQLFIADTVSSRHTIRAMLADETGLGKTIEACLILHRLVVSGKISRVLILVPSHLVYQWFVELLRRFNLSFAIVSKEQSETLGTGEHPFSHAPFFIADIEVLTQNTEYGNSAVTTDWDMVIVDEAHHLEKEGTGFSLVKRFSEQVKHLLFLTATPEQYGRHNHFTLLQLLDRERYPRFEDYERESETHHSILTSIEKTLLAQGIDLTVTSPETVHIGFSDADGEALPYPGKMNLGMLIDVYGIGRTMFRNTRRNIAGFPKREVHIIPLEMDGPASGCDPLVPWLITLMNGMPEAKVLVICSTKGKVEQLHKEIGRTMRMNISLYHEAMTILQRDRNAAWFADEHGARLLISSEIGSEGRNFQFCQSLVLYDLPLNPELLEQRIGRLDRIGQKAIIHIYVPYVKNTSHEILCRWYHEGLNAFACNVPAAGRVFEEVRTDLFRYCEQESVKACTVEVQAFITNTRALCVAFSQQITDSRDKLFAMISHQSGRSQNLIRKGQDAVLARATEVVMGQLLRMYGIAIEDAGQKKYALVTEHVTDPEFPLPRNPSPIITFSREIALAREEVEFITMDHPMLMGALELYLSSENGTCAFCVWKDGRKQERVLEIVFVLECIAPAELNSGRFLPPAPIRVVVAPDGRDVTSNFPAERIDAACLDRTQERFTNQENPIVPLLQSMMKQGEAIAGKTAKQVVRKAMDSMRHLFTEEMERLLILEKRGGLTMVQEKELCDKELAELEKYMQASRIRLDSLRAVWPNPSASTYNNRKNDKGCASMASEFDDETK